MVRYANYTRRTSLFLRLERLELRDVPSFGAEDYYSMPQLDGMNQSYPIDPPAITRIPADELAATHSGIVPRRPLLAEPRGRFAIGSGAGQLTTVNVYDAQTNALLGILTPYGPNFTHGARVATGDITGDGIEDIIVAPGSGFMPLVKVFDGVTLKEKIQFLAYSIQFTGGVFVAAGDVDADGRADVVTGAGFGGGPHVRMFSGADLITDNPNRPANGPNVSQMNFFAYSAEFTGGASVAVADFNGDGYADIVTGAGTGGGPHVIVFSGRDGSELQNFFAFDPSLRTGVSVAAGDLRGDGFTSLIAVPMIGAVPEVQVFVDGNAVASFMPFEADSDHGAGVAVRDLDQDGNMEVLLTSGPGMKPQVRVFRSDNWELLREFPALPPSYLGGLYVG